MSKKDEALDLALEALENLFGIPAQWTGEGGGDVAVWRLGGSHRAQAAIAAIKQARSTPVQNSDHEFKNFHRLLCDRFGYTHDEVDWKRDQISLIEWIAKQVKPAAPEPLTDEQIDEMSQKFTTGRAQGDHDFARAIEAAHGIAASKETK